ncbi:MAG: DUF4876 domain-containing protein [Filimonas sp.]|nr:DUF4876 domain-containing protein [Filimonas sp.]
MKTINIYIILFAALLIASCKKDASFAPTVKPITVSVKATYDTSGGNYVFPLSNIYVKLTNLYTTAVITGYTDANGTATFKDITAGNYDVNASITISRQTYESITGLPLSRDSITLNGGLSKITVNDVTNKTIDIKLMLGSIGDWVFKQIYYAGSNASTGAVFRDQFVEIYNNSNHVLYADSLCIAQVYGSNTAAPDYTKGYYITEGVLKGQYDWTKSLGMPSGIGAVDKYVYAKTIMRIPGTGTTYPVQPGGTILIAATAINHKAPYVGADGTAIPIKDPSLTVDLSKADFEVYLGKNFPSPLNSDIDNPNVPNMEVIDRGGNKDWILDNLGRDAMIIFKSNGDMVGKYSQYPDPTVTSISSATTQYFQVPIADVIDGVQIQHAVPASRVPRKITGTIDGGATNVPAGQYSSQSIIRKTAKTIGGRRVLTDTNNSTTDFDYLSKSEPGAFK